MAFPLPNTKPKWEKMLAPNRLYAWTQYNKKMQNRNLPMVPYPVDTLNAAQIEKFRDYLYNITTPNPKAIKRAFPEAFRETNIDRPPTGNSQEAGPSGEQSRGEKRPAEVLDEPVEEGPTRDILN